MSSLLRVSECHRQAWAFSLLRMVASTCPCLAAHRSGVSPVTLGASLFALPKPCQSKKGQCQSKKGQGILGARETRLHNTPPQQGAENAATATAVDLGCRLFKRSRKTFALSLALFGPFWDLHYSSYLLYQLWGSESKLAAPTWPPCEAMSTGVLSRTAKLLGGWTNSCGRDGWANAWAVQSD